MASSVDTKQLREHVFQLASAGALSQVGVEAATKLAARRIQAMAREAFVGTRYWKKVPQDITWDVERKDDEVRAEIGRERGTGGQGAMMHWLEYGTSRQGPIKPSLGPALDANADIYEKAIVAAATAPLGAGIGRMGRLSR